MSDYKLVYYGVRGRAEPMRLSFVAAGKKFEDVKIGMEPDSPDKEKAPYGQLPYFVYKGKIFGESKAIASFVAKECGLAGKSNEDAMRVDEVYCLAAGLLEAMGKVAFEADAAKKAEGEKNLAETIVPKYLKFFQRLLKENGDKGFFVGSALTQADLSAYDITDTVLGKHDKALDDYPEIQKMRKNVDGNANIKAYLASRPKTDL